MRTLALLALLAAPAAADTLTIRTDLGGDVGRRGNAIAAMTKSGRTVAIEGACYSACTMYLALPQACVAQGAVLGFHAPTGRRAPLTATEFEFWSQTIAAHYPPALARWYLAEARHSRRILKLSGTQAVTLGAQPCEVK